MTITRAKLFEEVLYGGKWGLAVSELDAMFGIEWLDPMLSLYEMGLVEVGADRSGAERVYPIARASMYCNAMYKRPGMVQ